VRIGANVQMATLDQGREGLDPSSTLEDALTGGRGDTLIIRGQSRHVVGYMRDFLFAPEQRRTPLGVLSGGERGRLMLARALAKPSNMLVLDEPTNDLDLETLDVLEEMIGDYAGTVILISHDRDFLDRTVNAVIVAEGDGRWTEYAGGYTDMLAQRGEAIAERKPAKVAAKPAPPVAVPKAGRRRLSFNEKHALETLPREIAALQRRIQELQHKLDDPGLYARDRAAFADISASLTTAQQELSAAEEKWLALEILREEIESDSA
jgi:ATP-binding cassette subfamily F protein uup